ncbi:MAG: hypothetical protein CM1200mP2_25880 [Planctomycetaceae bacterium]|nr:MAG: hypothetical protein CM1200mP2_25880 [Planctomycetaceae bacterium]
MSTPPPTSTQLNSSPLLAWMQLVRLPTVFTALADILLGTQLVVPAEATTSPRALGLLLVASAGLYLAGMVFNDVFDRHRDAVERPGRPLPSGRITLSSAVTLGTVLMIGGVVAAATADGSSSRAGLLVALGLAVCVLAYDGLLKTTPLGPVAMGACRSLNVLLGATIGGSLEALAHGPPLHVAAGLGIYITGVTWFARNEAGSSTRGQLTAAVLLINIGLATLIPFCRNEPDRPATGRLHFCPATDGPDRGVDQPETDRRHSGSTTRTCAIRSWILLLSLIMIDATLPWPPPDAQHPPC